MFAKVTLITATACHLATALVARDPFPGSHPPVDPAFVDEFMEWKLVLGLPSTGFSKKEWPAGMLPQGCVDAANYYRQPTNGMSAFEVTYDDCSVPWVICRGVNTVNSDAALIDVFGRMPVHMRQYISNLVDFGSGGLGGYAAAATHPDGWMALGSIAKVKMFAHEMSHNVDIYGWGNGNARYSETDDWRRAYERDSASPTPYARESLVEDYAEIGMIATFQHAGGNLDELTSGWRGFGTTLDEFDRHFSHISRGGSCDVRIENSPAVAIGGKASKVSGAKDIDTNIKDDSIKVLKPNKNLKMPPPYPKE